MVEGIVSKRKGSILVLSGFLRYRFDPEMARNCRCSTGSNAPQSLSGHFWCFRPARHWRKTNYRQPTSSS
jgi:hypothetical protein